VSAAAKLLHNNLYIDFIDGSCADINLILIIGTYKACSYSLDIKKLIGSLCTNNSRTCNVLVGENRYCESVLVNLGLADCIGQKKDVYVYDRFNSLFEVQQVDKFTKDMVGCILQTEVKEIIVDDYFIKIRYDYEGKTYESKQTFGKYMESMKQWFVDPQKKEREYQKFEDKYGVPVSEKDSLIGHPLMVEVKAAFGTHYYGDIKKFPKTRK